MSEHKIPIPSMIYNAAVGGHVTNSQQIIDEDYNLEQKDINKEILGVPYNASNPNGMGKIVLKKNDNFKQVVEAQTNGNTIFVIKYDFTLTDNVTVPSNCVLEFDGGSISSTYTLTCNNTLFTGNITSKINLTGTLANKEICINDFLDNKAVLDFARVNSIIGTLNYATVNFNGEYSSVMNNDDNDMQIGIKLISNIHYIGNNSIINYPIEGNVWGFIFNDAHNYEGIDYVENIVIDGFNFKCSRYSSDSGSHHCCTIALGRVKNCKITNCIFNNWIGDAITAAYVFNPQRTAHVKGFTENIIIDNCKFLGTGTEDNWKERNAMGILDCDGFTISNCLFKDMGNSTQPSCIDFEPEQIDGVNVMNIKRVIIENCNFLNVQAGVGNIAFVGSTVTTDPEYIIIRNNTFKDGKNGLRLGLDFKYFIDSNIFDLIVNPARIDNGVSIIVNNTFNSCSYQLFVGYSLSYPTVILNKNIFKACKGHENRGFIICHISGLLSCENNYIENCTDDGGDVKHGLITSIALSEQEDSENNNIIFVDNIFVTNNSNFIGIYKNTSVRKLKDLNTKIIGWDGTPGYYTPNMALDSAQIICKE